VSRDGDSDDLTEFLLHLADATLGPDDRAYVYNGTLIIRRASLDGEPSSQTSQTSSASSVTAQTS
jgi:hypothetical protein